VSDGQPADRTEHTRRTLDAYERLASVWSATTDEGPFNGYLERPALRSLVPRPLIGVKVLDAGCGSGAQCAWLLAEGAEVVGVDLSSAMVDEAKRRCEGRGRFIVADLAEPLPLEAHSVDGITCSLALHYLEDWWVPLRSFATALSPGGWVVISLDHPFGSPLLGQAGGYFDTELVSDTWNKGGVEVTQHFLAAAAGGGDQCLRRRRLRRRTRRGGPPHGRSIGAFSCRAVGGQRSALVHCLPAPLDQIGAAQTRLAPPVRLPRRQRTVPRRG